MSLITIAILNNVLLWLTVIMASRSWNQVLYIVIFEAVWIVLASIVLCYAPWILDLDLYLLMLVILSISAVEMVLCFLSFIVFYHVTNFIATGSFQPKTLKFYIAEFKKTKVYANLFQF